MFCSRCGIEIEERAIVCPFCGVRTGFPLKGKELPNATMMMLLPVGRAKFAVVAGYLGLLAAIPPGYFAPFAIFFGILAIIDIRKNPEKPGIGRALLGIVGGSLSSLFHIFIYLISK